jgi:hypothetical protein
MASPRLALVRVEERKRLRGLCFRASQVVDPSFLVLLSKLLFVHGFVTRNNLEKTCRLSFVSVT